MKRAPSPRFTRTSRTARNWTAPALVLVCAFALGAPLNAGADAEAQTSLSPGLLDAAQAQPDAAFKVIVEGAADSDTVSAEIREVAEDDEADLHSFLTVPAVAGTLTGSEIVALANGSEPLVISRDSPVTATDDPEPPAPPPTQATSEEPMVAGDPEPGVWLTATPGLWSGSGTPSYAFQWQRCGTDLRSAALLADSPAGYWPASELDGDVEVSGPEVGTFSSAFTFEGWVEVGEPQSDRLLISRWFALGDGIATRGGWDSVGGVRLYLDENGHYALAVGNYQHRYVRTSIGPVAGEREHLAGTWDGSVMRLYRNGVQIGSADLAGTLADSSVELTIGREVDQAALYGRALTPE